MNIQNLKEYLANEFNKNRVKNYKVLCKLLQVPETGGNVKKATLKELETYFSIVKEGNSYVFNQTYENKIIKPDGERSKYGKTSECLIRNLLQNSNKNKISIRPIELVLECGFCNEKLLETYEFQSTNYESKIPEYDFNTFITTIKNEGYTTVHNTLTSMKKRKLIYFDERKEGRNEDGVYCELTRFEDEIYSNIVWQTLNEITPFYNEVGAEKFANWQYAYSVEYIDILKFSKVVKEYYKRLNINSFNVLGKNKIRKKWYISFNRDYLTSLYHEKYNKDELIQNNNQKFVEMLKKRNDKKYLEVSHKELPSELNSEIKIAWIYNKFDYADIDEIDDRYYIINEIIDDLVSI